MKAPIENRPAGRRAPGTIARILATALVLCASCVLTAWGAAYAGDGSFQTSVNPGGGTIVTGTVGGDSLAAGAAAVLRRVHAALGAKPAVAQVARNDREGSLALLFVANANGRPYTGIALVQANPGAQTAAVAMYDTAARFHTTLAPMMRRLGAMTQAGSKSNGPGVKFAPAQPLSAHSFSDGTGSISIPAGWQIVSAGGGSAMAAADGNAAQVSYNMDFSGLDPSNPRAQMFLRTASPMARQNFHGAVLPYTGDAVKSWVAMYEAVGRERGFQPEIHVTRSSSGASPAIADFTGTLGSGAKTIHFIVHAFVLPPNPNGMWTLSDSHVFVNESELARQSATANAVLASVRINFGAVAAQQDAIRQSFQRLFESEIANDRAQDAARQERTDEALASDRAAQESMHKDAVAMENYSLDRAVVVDTDTGVHSTVGSGFADALVQANSNYQKVPASDLLRGVDY